MNKPIKQIIQISAVGISISLLTACNIESSDMWSSDGFDSYSSHTVVESYDTAPAPRHHRHWHNHWRRGWEPAPRPRNEGHYGPRPKPARNSGHYGPPTQKPKNQGHYGPSTSSSSNSGHYGPSTASSESSGHYGPSTQHKMAANTGHSSGPFSPVQHGLKH
ncbi:MAG: hypothetical protein P1U63_01915 [Coxiellaceae bacterium]|nr:hypothetical protein [Coxiellaceae bacterium]